MGGLKVVDRMLLFLGVMTLALIPASTAFAWGDTGHKIICEIAFQELGAPTRERVRGLMRQDQEFSLFSESCTWPDHPRQRAVEHYVNLRRDAAGIGADKCPVAELCVVSAIESDLAVLGSPTASDREQLDALKFLGHWVGDVHQPMHVSFQDDKGANDIRETGPCTGNLHAVWDTCILERGLGKDVRTIAAELSAEITPQERADWLDSSVVDWVNESFAITTSPTVGYCVQQQGACWYEATNERFDRGEATKAVVVDDAYIDAHLATVKERLKQAAVRLAGALNEAFGD
jgi:hypothetical protein